MSTVGNSIHRDEDLRRTFGLEQMSPEQLRYLHNLSGEIVANAVMTWRTEVSQRLADPRRNIARECGHPDTFVPEQYQDLYDRDPIAARVVQIYPRECWQLQPLVYEDEDEKALTPFEADWNALSHSLGGS